MSENRNPDPQAAADSGSRRTVLLVAVIGAFALAGIAFGAHWYFNGRYLVATDNAYVGGNVVQITPQITGTVIGIGADDTQFVRAGQTLVQLDKADADVALQDAESQLARTVRGVRNLFASSAQQQANLEIRRSELAKARDDLARRERLSASGAVSGEDVLHAREAARSAEAAVAAAEQQLAATSALVDRTTVQSHPDVQKAAAAAKNAYLNAARTVLPAPVSGYVAKRNVQLGQRVSPGTPLMAVVPLDEVWVDANFKESQLENIRIGQPATLTADIYGSKVEFHGKVAGFGAGTGAAFSLLPAQNATGNWIKIVQRLPVRIALDPAELAAHPLQVGLSMQVEVDSHDRGGKRLPQATPAAPAYKTAVFGSLDEESDKRVQAIIGANIGATRHAAAARPTKHI
ncbi:MAG: efflux RND transporter periplasmic adaptor subunit [Proteobacteria bacterium]|nr:efflux RND transporter periplasmic adaptor subunit [Pseudomonadota bacterium]